MFPCEYCKIFKNSYFEEHLRTAALERKKIRSTDAANNQEVREDRLVTSELCYIMSYFVNFFFRIQSWLNKSWIWHQGSHSSQIWYQVLGWQGNNINQYINSSLFKNFVKHLRPSFLRKSWMVSVYNETISLVYNTECAK